MKRMKFCHLSPTQMDLEDYVSEISQIKTNTLSAITRVWNLK